jgi:hypothetical protein
MPRPGRGVTVRASFMLVEFPALTSTLWIEERDKPVWHRVATRVRALEYRAACGWELSAREGRIWSQKPHDVGPKVEDRCHTCIGT